MTFDHRNKRWIWFLMAGVLLAPIMAFGAVAAGASDSGSAPADSRRDEEFSEDLTSRRNRDRSQCNEESRTRRND